MRRIDTFMEIYLIKSRAFSDISDKKKSISSQFTRSMDSIVFVGEFPLFIKMTLGENPYLAYKLKRSSSFVTKAKLFSKAKFPISRSFFSRLKVNTWTEFGNSSCNKVIRSGERFASNKSFIESLIFYFDQRQMPEQIIGRF